MEFEIINPYTQEKIDQEMALTDSALESALTQAYTSWKSWRMLKVEERITYFENLKKTVEIQVEDLALCSSESMGKPFTQAKAELKKCLLLLDYYIKNGSSFLQPKTIETDAQQSFVNYQSLGVILGIMPWNFPYWQVFRFAIPALLSGNTVLVKHAPNTMNIGRRIGELFAQANFPSGVYTHSPITEKQVKNVIADDRIQGCSVTGSEKAGAAVATEAGKHIKKCVLELGGNNAFVILEDAELKQVAKVAAKARMQNNGQSCIAAKRFLVHNTLADAFCEQLAREFSSYSLSQPTEVSCKLGPLARLDLAEKLEEQIKKALNHGGELMLGGKRKGTYVEPTIIKGVDSNNPAFYEELFGPVALVSSFSTLDDAIAMVNESHYGLGVSFFTKSQGKLVLKRASEINEGAIFINDMVKSDPRLPFGGVKKSGYGRELGRETLMEFCNQQTVYIS